MTTPFNPEQLADDKLLALLAEDVFDGLVPEVAAEVRIALSRGLPAEMILNQGLVPGMDRVSAAFSAQQIFVPEMAAAARAMRAGLDLLHPSAAPDVSRGRAVVGSVRGDLHDLGKSLVAMALAGQGFAVTDLGVNVRPEAFVAAVAEQRPQVLCLSAHLTTTMPFVKDVIAALETAGLRQGLLILVGGAPLNDGFARQFGADAYTADAAGAAALARAWVEQQAGRQPS